MEKGMISESVDRVVSTAFNLARPVLTTLATILRTSIAHRVVGIIFPGGLNMYVYTLGCPDELLG
jgi:hypothetical protein